MYTYNLKNKSKVVLKAALVLGFYTLILSSCSTGNSAERPVVKPLQIRNKGRDQYPAAQVSFMRPTYTISLPGELKPYEQVAVHAKVSGFVKRLYVDRGDKVRKGQLLALLEAPEMDQQYLSEKSTEEQLKNDFLYAQRAYDRLLAAAKTTGAVAQLELDRAESSMRSAKSAYEAAKASATGNAAMQTYLRIVAPFDGIITQRNVSVGALTAAASGGPLFQMAQNDKLRLTLSLPEKYASSVQRDMSVTFTVSAHPGKAYEASLSRNAGVVDQQDRALTLEFDVLNKNGDLMGGDYAQVRLDLQRRDSTYWVPGNTVVNSQSGMFVLARRANTIRRIAVKEGVMLDSLTEVFGDLNRPDSILLKPSEEIQEGEIKN